MDIRLKRWALVPALALVCAGAASAQTADEVVEKTLTALGGREALGKLTSRHTTGTIVVSTPGGNVPGTIEIFNQAPNKVRTLIALDLSSLGADKMTIDQRFDGTSGVAMDTMQGNREITGDQLANMKNADFPTPLLRYKQLGTTIALAERQKIGDREAVALAITPREGPASKLFVDAESYLPMRLVVTLELPDVGRVEQTSDLSDYHDVDGVKMPFSIHNSSAVQTVSVTVTKVDNNAAVDPALFARPSGG
jgi:outer membrane lipoprotein-sorting protein